MEGLLGLVDNRRCRLFSAWQRRLGYRRDSDGGWRRRRHRDRRVGSAHGALLRDRGFSRRLQGC